MEVLTADGSAVEQICEMKRGQTFSRAFFLPVGATPDEIKEARRNLTNYMAPVVARARKKRKRNYKVHTCTGFTDNYNVVVTGVITVERGE